MTNTPSPEDRALIESLRSLALKANFPSTIDDLTAAADRLESLLSDRAKLEEALKPFATLAQQYDPPEDDDGLPLMRHDGDELNLGHLRDARAALKDERALVPPTNEGLTGNT